MPAKKTAIQVLKARDLLSLNPEKFEYEYGKVVELIYDDGQSQQVSTRSVMYSWFLWEYQRRYPQLPLLARHHVNHFLKGEMLSAKTHISMLQALLRELVYEHGMDSAVQIEELNKLAYDVVNQMYNELGRYTSAYVTTLNILDIVRLSGDKEVLEHKASAQKGDITISEMYGRSQRRILENPENKTNPVVQMIRMGTLNINQVNQCLFARGLTSEVTGQVMRTPVMESYADGMYSFYGYAATSADARKHMYSAEAPLQDTEYFARRLQLVNMNVFGIGVKDCGTTHYLPWLIHPPSYQGSRKLRDSDLDYMKGKWYLCPESQKLKVIKGDEKHLHGQTIMLRSGIYCQDPDPHKICATCFGNLYLNVSRFANLGHLCAANMTQSLTQNILSTKHLIGTATGSEIKMTHEMAKYFTFNYSNMSYYLKPMNPQSEYKLVMNRLTAIGLTDFRRLSAIEHISPQRISALETLELYETNDKGATFILKMNIHQGNRKGFFSSEFLNYVRNKGLTTNEYDYFVFDLKDWNPKYPMIRIPDVEYSYSDHADQIAELIESNKKRLQQSRDEITPAGVLQNLFDLVNSKMFVPLSLLEVMVYANMTPGLEDYGMARGVEKPIMNVSRSITSNRSLGPAYLFEMQAKVITNPRSFFAENRPDTPLDVFLAPKEYVEHHKRRQGIRYP